MSGKVAELVGHIDIGLRWRRVAARMVMRDNQRRGVQAQSALNDLARIDRRVVHRAAPHHFIGDNAILFIEKYHVEFLDFVFGHFGAAINYQIIPTGQQVAFEDFRLPNTKGSRLNGLKFKNDALGDIGEACQLGRVRQS
jgi:hypothetical protein